jgi:hypothetical protein
MGTVNIVAARDRSRPVPVGTSYFDMLGFGYPCTVSAIPGGGGTLTLSYSTTPGAAGLEASANWIAWPAGTVSAAASATLISPVTGIRAVAATAAGVVEITG